jgi:GntR family transcriptional regulator/MocR family aminotransferase
MARWHLSLTIPGPEDGADAPLFQRIAWAIADEIRRGRLAPGAPLPGSRRLATELGVHRNTVIAAYAELRAEGWIEATTGSATRVAAVLAGTLPPTPQAFAPTRLGVPLEAGFDLPGPAPATSWPEPPRAQYLLAGGFPDLRQVPTQALARAWRRAITRNPAALLAYGDPRGDDRLRAALAEMLATLRGLATTADDVLVTRGSQMALDLVGRTLLSSGDAVVVEALGYQPAWAAFRAAGATLLPLPVDAAGLRVDLLPDLLARHRVRAVYVTPHHQYPTTVTLSAARRLQLLNLAATHRFAVIEDDYDHEFHYEGRPVLPLASADPHGVVVYLGTLSKVLAPGLRVGFVVAPAALLERLAELRTRVDRQGDHITERAVAELLEDGEVQRHARRMRRVYAERRDVLGEALRTHLGDAVSFELPSGGMSLWARLDDALPAEALAAEALKRGVGVYIGRRFAFDDAPLQALRLGFGGLEPAALREAARRLGESAGVVGGRRAP